MRLLRSDGHGVADAVLCILVGKLCHRQARSQPAMTISSVHRVRAWSERLAFSASVRGITRGFAVHDIGCDREHALRMRRVSISGVLSYLLHEAGDDLRRDLIDAVVVVAKL